MPDNPYPQTPIQAAPDSSESALPGKFEVDQYSVTRRYTVLLACPLSEAVLTVDELIFVKFIARDRIARIRE
jgi:hypothetical protein